MFLCVCWPPRNEVCGEAICVVWRERHLQETTGDARIREPTSNWHLMVVKRCVPYGHVNCLHFNQYGKIQQQKSAHLVNGKPFIHWRDGLTIVFSSIDMVGKRMRIKCTHNGENGVDAFLIDVVNPHVRSSIQTHTTYTNTSVNIWLR